MLLSDLPSSYVCSLCSCCFVFCKQVQKFELLSSSHSCCSVECYKSSINVFVLHASLHGGVGCFIWYCMSARLPMDSQLSHFLYSSVICVHFYMSVTVHTYIPFDWYLEFLLFTVFLLWLFVYIFLLLGFVTLSLCENLPDCSHDEVKRLGMIMPS